MSSKTNSGQMTNEANKAVETTGSRVPPSKKRHGKVPKRVHKAEREKIKREHLNELFLSLANSLELSEPNSGKAAVLSEAIRVVKDMLEQIECLRSENASLLSESQYVTTEANELHDENSALETQIKQLQTEIKERTSQSNLDLNVTPEFQDQDSMSQFTNDRLTLQQAQIMNPMYVIRFQPPQSQVNEDLTAPQVHTMPASVVSKPHARYATSDDTWSFRILGKRQELGDGLQCCRGDGDSGLRNVSSG